MHKAVYSACHSGCRDKQLPVVTVRFKPVLSHCSCCQACYQQNTATGSKNLAVYASHHCDKKPGNCHCIVRYEHTVLWKCWILRFLTVSHFTSHGILLTIHHKSQTEIISANMCMSRLHLSH